MQPFVTVVVGIRNEEKYIEECIVSLLDLDYPKDNYEIIIVDGMSTDKTREIVGRYPVRLIPNEKINVAAARNLGVKNAKGDFVAFTDGDCKVDEMWLKTLVHEMQQAPEDVACVGGPNLVFDTDPVFARVVGYAQETLLGSGGSAQCHGYQKKQYVQSLPNCNAFYKKSVIEEVGYFDEYFVLGQDGDLNFRIGKAGYKFLFVPEAKVWHHRRGTIKTFSVRMFKYGAWMAELFKKHREVVRWYAFLPVFAILFTFISMLSAFKYAILIYIWLFLLAFYLLFVSITTLGVMHKMGSLTGLLTFAVIPIQHVMYGFGVLYKIITLSIKNYLYTTDN